MRRCFVLTTLMMLLSISYLTPPVSGFVTLQGEFALVHCVDDGNNLHVYATELDQYSFNYDAVCDDDPYDWYHFAGWGDVNFDGGLTVATDGPGLDIRLYFDNGGGIVDVLQTTAEYIPDNGLYRTAFSIEQACLDAGFPPPLTGDFWVRISVLGGYSGIHPYYMQFLQIPLPSLPGGNNSRLDAEELPIGENLYGTLAQADFYDWYSWEQPTGDPGDGIIELSMIHLIGSEDIPITKVVVFSSSGPELGSATLGGDQWFAYVDLSPLSLGPGTYYIDVLLEEAVIEPVCYCISNKATYGTGGGCLPDSNEDSSSSIPISANTIVSGTICHPRDHVDYYRFFNDSYFIGDILLRPFVMEKVVNIVVKKGNDYILPSPGTRRCRSFYRDPLPPGTFDIVVLDFFPSQDAASYELIVYPNGAGTYEAPGHGSWDTADDILDSYTNPWPHTFELEPGQQDRYCYRASTGSEFYLLGWLSVYGSRPDYEVRVGKVSVNGPIWGQTFRPGADGKVSLDFAYQVLTEPGDHILRILLDPTVTERRRFCVEAHAFEGMCYEEIPDDFQHPAVNIYYSGGDILNLTDALCPGTDDVDYAEFTVGNDFAMNEVPSDCRMIVKAGYPYMGFKLYDSSQNIIWAQQIAELGGTAGVNLDGLVQNGETYILEVNVQSTEERLMTWQVEFLPPVLGIRGPVFELMRVDLDSR